MKQILRSLYGARLHALIVKELNQIRRDKRLAMSMIVPPTLQVLLFGFALNSTVEYMKMGVLDWSRTPESRELIAGMTESRAFRLTRTYLSPADLTGALSRGEIKAAA